MYDIEFSKAFEKKLDKLDNNILKAFYQKLEKLIFNPYETNTNLDIKFLKNSQNDYRLRIGKYRFLYTIEKDKILIFFFKVGSRGDVYK